MSAADTLLSILDDVLRLAADFNEIEEPWDSSAGMKARVRVAVKLLTVLAAQSSTALDDQLVALLAKLTENDALLDLFARLVGWELQPSAMSVEAKAAVQADAEAMGLDWAQLVNLAILVARVIGQLRG